VQLNNHNCFVFHSAIFILLGNISKHQAIFIKKTKDWI